jgi:hypothetical protein
VTKGLVDPDVKVSEQAGGPDMAAQLELSKAVAEHYRFFIQLADQKAAFLFTGQMALLATLYSKGAIGAVCSQPRGSCVASALAGAAVLALAFGAVAVASAVVPRTSSGTTLYNQSLETNRTDSQAVSARLLSMDMKDVCREQATYIGELSQVSVRKYRWLRIAFQMTAAGAIAASGWLVLLVNRT